jgi:hypothetical protein
MPRSKKQRIVQQFASVHDQFKKRALEQAKKVPWPTLVAAVDRYNDWQVFSLWLRAVIDAAGSVPPLVKQELENKIPGFLARVEEDLRAARDGKLGHRLWNLVDAWVTTNILLEPQVQGWLDAVHYFASVSLPYMKTWAHWECVNAEWWRTQPAEWPTYRRWQEDVAAVSRLPNPDSVLQQVLSAVRTVPAGEWQHIWHAFFDLIAFSLWMELILDLEGPGSQLVKNELAKCYPGFRFTCPDPPSSDAVRDLNSWVAQHLLRTSDEKLLAALGWHVQHHPGYYAIRNYAGHCHDVWPNDNPNRLPSFDEWRQVTQTHPF